MTQTEILKEIKNKESKHILNLLGIMYKTRKKKLFLKSF